MVQTVFNSFEIAGMDLWPERLTQPSSTTWIIVAASTTRDVLHQYLSIWTEWIQLRFHVWTAVRWRTHPHNLGIAIHGQGWGLPDLGGWIQTFPVYSLPPRWHVGAWQVFLQQGGKPWYMAGLLLLAHMCSLMFLCLDYYRGWSCLLKWQQTINQGQEQWVNHKCQDVKRPVMHRLRHILLEMSSPILGISLLLSLLSPSIGWPKPSPFLLI